MIYLQVIVRYLHCCFAFLLNNLVFYIMWFIKGAKVLHLLYNEREDHCRKEPR
jgi:hypothetical protein